MVKKEIKMSPPVADAMDELRNFMYFEKVYFHPARIEEEKKLSAMIEGFYHYYMEHFELLPHNISANHISTQSATISPV